MDLGGFPRSSLPFREGLQEAVWEIGGLGQDVGLPDLQSHAEVRQSPLELWANPSQFCQRSGDRDVIQEGHSQKTPLRRLIQGPRKLHDGVNEAQGKEEGAPGVPLLHPSFSLNLARGASYI